MPEIKCSVHQKKYSIPCTMGPHRPNHHKRAQQTARSLARPSRTCSVLTQRAAAPSRGRRSCHEALTMRWSLRRVWNSALRHGTVPSSGAGLSGHLSLNSTLISCVCRATHTSGASEQSYPDWRRRHDRKRQTEAQGHIVSGSTN